MIEYRGYIGHFSFDETKNMFFGRVTNTHNLITFQGKSVKEIQAAFQDTIDEYIAGSKKHGPSVKNPS